MALVSGWTEPVTCIINVKVSNGLLTLNVRRYRIIVQLMDPNASLLQIALKPTHKVAVLLVLTDNVPKIS